MGVQPSRPGVPTGGGAGGRHRPTAVRAPTLTRPPAAVPSRPCRPPLPGRSPAGRTAIVGGEASGVNRPGFAGIALNLPPATADITDKLRATPRPRTARRAPARGPTGRAVMGSARRWLVRGVAGVGVTVTALTGCQTYPAGFGGMTLPSPHYLKHYPQYFPPDPPFPLQRELDSMQNVEGLAPVAVPGGA